ncbi:MAG: hypothetical protein JXR73_02740 [Candidatus Omnitrophica bacterium]|nr:hypothetical protein [Candidatus Omnitrophota bacterium]
MRKSIGLVLCLVIASLGAYGQSVREYTCNKVTGDPPVIDGEYTEEEWAGSEWTGDFYPLRHSANPTSMWGNVIDEKWQWRALWDDEYLYFLVSAELKYINKNGWTWAGDIIAPLEADDTGYAGWGVGTNLDFEIFLTPQWDEELTAFPNEAGANPPGYQCCYFPLLEDVEGDVEYAPSNFGIRNTTEGPPFFHTGTVGSQSIGGWNPIYDPAEAEAAGVKPFILAALPHLIEGAVEGEEVVGIPVLEIAFPFSQFSFPALTDVEVIEDVDIIMENMIMIPDENGKYIADGDEWLVNVAGYTDGAVAESGLGLISWNDMGDGGFHNAPRGILRFTGAVNVSSWMLH